MSSVIPFGINLIRNDLTTGTGLLDSRCRSVSIYTRSIIGLHFVFLLYYLLDMIYAASFVLMEGMADVLFGNGVSGTHHIGINEHQ